MPGYSFAQLGLENTKHDSALPVDIASDKLTVHYKKKLAVFEDNVVAVQGTLRIAADRMEVLYHGGDKPAQKNAKDAGQGDGDEARGLEKITAIGHVKLAVPGKTASSEQGVYDVDKGEVVLTGHVVLVNDANRLSGDRFVYDVTNRVSHLYSDKKEVPEGAGAAARGGKAEKPAFSGRVKGYFIPKKKMDIPAIGPGKVKKKTGE